MSEKLTRSEMDEAVASCRLNLSLDGMLKAPDGEHSGTWSGYQIEFEADGVRHRLATKDGVRGIDVPVRFTVLGGELVESSIKV